MAGQREEGDGSFTDEVHLTHPHLQMLFGDPMDWIGRNNGLFRLCQLLLAERVVLFSYPASPLLHVTQTTPL